jgi:5-methylcytosine-specific restriction endonuclease McrA
MNFEYKEDKIFFQHLFKEFGGLEINHDLFDSSDPLLKRQAFNRIRNKVFRKLQDKFGDICMLNFHADCANSADQVDHLIPLSSNILNKTIRAMKAEKGKKVSAQSLGSNNDRNFVLSCSRCNAAKKHHIPDNELFNKVLCLYF